jgi:predicted ATP-grasp superfamily ATP-dependent carboligase
VSLDNPRYLLKPVRGTGGRGIRVWTPTQPIDRHHYLQRYVAGKPISAVYSGNGKQMRLVGVTEQIIGDTAFGVPSFHYCGSVGPIALTDRQERAVAYLGAALTRLFSLRGVFGVDAVIDKAGEVWPVEVNPRYTASVEILERAGCVPALLPLNVACATQRPIICDPRQTQDASPSTKTLTKGTSICAKAIAFAKRDVRVGNLLQIFQREQVVDVPSPGEVIDSGWPICTLLAHGCDSNTCVTRLRAMAKRLDAHLPTS